MLPHKQEVPEKGCTSAGRRPGFRHSSLLNAPLGPVCTNPGMPRTFTNFSPVLRFSNVAGSIASTEDHEKNNIGTANSPAAALSPSVTLRARCEVWVYHRPPPYSGLLPTDWTVLPRTVMMRQIGAAAFSSSSAVQRAAVHTYIMFHLLHAVGLARKVPLQSTASFAGAWSLKYYYEPFIGSTGPHSNAGCQSVPV